MELGKGISDDSEVLVFCVCDECMPILNLDRIKTF